MIASVFPWRLLSFTLLALAFLALGNEVANACAAVSLDGPTPAAAPFRFARPIWVYVAQRESFLVSPGVVALAVFGLFAAGLSLHWRWYLICSAVAFSAAYVAGVERPIFVSWCGPATYGPLSATGQYAILAWGSFATTLLYYNFKTTDVARFWRV